jgi:tetratricopeptide (TPR) repeat protein
MNERYSIIYRSSEESLKASALPIEVSIYSLLYRISLESMKFQRHIGFRLTLTLCIGLGVSLAAQQDTAAETRISRDLEAAQQAERAQDYPTASRQYEEILKLQPKAALIRQSLAITYHLQNRYPEAIAEFERALRLDPKLWGCYLFMGMDYFKTNQFALAIAPLEKSISLNAKMAEPEARFWLAATYSALNKPNDAVRELRRDLVLRPDNLDVLYYLTKAYDQAAASAFQRLGEIDSQAAAVSLLQAQRFLEENRADLALVQYRNALRLRPDFAGWIPALAAERVDTEADADLPISAADARANLNLAGLLAAVGGRDQAAAILMNLAKQKAANPKSTEIKAQANARLSALQKTPAPTSQANSAEVLQGIELVEQGRFREAEEPLSRAAEKNANPALQLFLLRAYIESGDCGVVEDRLSKLLAAEPDNVDALHLLGRCYQQQAESTLRRMIGIDNDFYGVHELLGRRHEEKTEYNLAIKEYQAALAKRPDLAGIRYAIGNVYRKMNQYSEAEKWLTEELARNPYHGLAHYRLGSILTEEDQPDAAIPHLLQALRSHPQLTDARLDLGRAYTEKGQYEDALTALKQVVHSEPGNDRVHYLLSVVYSKQGHKGEAQAELADYQRLTRERLQRTQQDIKDVSNSLDK